MKLSINRRYIPGLVLLLSLFVGAFAELLPVTPAQAATALTVRDQFDAPPPPVYTNNDGTANWHSNWVEVGDDVAGSAGAGSVLIENNLASNRLRISNSNRSIFRQANLSGAASATLSFDYRRVGLDDTDDYVVVEISAAGMNGPWTELVRYQGAGTDAGYTSASFTITPHISSRTTLRLRSSSNTGFLGYAMVAGDIVYFDNFQISYTIDGIAGTVFEDYNSDGIYNTVATATLRAIDRGVAGVTVTAYDVAGAVAATTTTNAQGDYRLPLTNAALTYRIEFSGWPASYQPAARSATSATSVQFVNGGDRQNINFGLFRPPLYCQNDPRLGTSCFREGARTGPDSTLGALYTYPYSANGTTVTVGGFDVPTGSTTLAQFQQIGSSGGMAYQRSSKTIFAGAFLSRGTDYGPNGSGAIYRINASGAPTPALFIDLDAQPGIDTGTIARGTPDWIQDTNAYANVGKMGLGDLEISDDDRTLYAVNLLQRTLMIIPLGTDANGQPQPQLDGTVTGFAVPTPASCDGGPGEGNASDVRPFGLKFYDGNLYLGMVCSAQSLIPTPPPATIAGLATARNAMRGYVYRFNPVTNTFDTTPLLEFPLNYSRRYINDSLTTEPENDGEWLPWFDGWRPGYWPINNAGSITTNPQPILSDIEFDAEGFMMIGLRDRFGNQHYDNGSPGPNGQADIQMRQGGDLLLACFDGLNWQLESGGSCGNRTTGGPTWDNSDSGPGGREFYYDEYWNATSGSLLYHHETGIGSLVVMPGTGELVSTSYDVFATFEAGTVVFDNYTGARRRAVQVYPANSGLGKGAGLGDVELLCDQAPIELGNRVWQDTNNNGVQDPGEPGLNGVTVELYRNGTRIGVATTDANGEYYFTSGTADTDANPNDNVINNGGIGIYPRTGTPGGNSQYEIRIPNISGATPQASLGNRALTTPNADATANGDSRDSDGAAVGDYASYTIPYADLAGSGYNRHTHDFGFVPTYALGNRVWYDANNNRQLDAGEQPVAGVEVRLFAADAAGAPTGAALRTITTDTNGRYRFDNLPAGRYVVVVSAGNFDQISDPLYGYASSTGNNTQNAAGNTPDSGDMGRDATSPQTAGIVSSPVNLGTDPTPTGEDQTAPAAGSISGSGGDPGDARNNLTVDFGFYRLAVGNQLWIEADDDGVFEAGETPLVNTQVQLVNATTGLVVGEALTDANGQYNITTTTAGDPLPPGDYRVRIPSPPAGYRPATSFTMAGGDSRSKGVLNTGVVESPLFQLQPGQALDSATVDTASATTRNPTLDFGFVELLSLGNLVWYDTNNNGQVDAGEQPISGVTVRLFRDDGDNTFDSGDTQVGADQLTDANGLYRFDGLEPGTYFVQIPPGSFSSGVLAGYRNSDGQTTADTNDRDHGTFVAGQGVLSHPVTLSFGGEPINDGDTNANTNLTIDFGFYRMTLGDRIWFDNNNNGLLDPAEVGVPDGITVELYDNGGTLVATTTTTGGNGSYLFDRQTVGAEAGLGLAPGDYTVRIPAAMFNPGGALAGYHSSNGAPDPDDDTNNDDNGSPVGTLGAGGYIAGSPITLTPGSEPTTTNATGTSTNLTLDFGVYTLSLGNLVWEDRNNNGSRDTGEPALEHITVRLYASDGTTLLRTTTTNASGHYLFTGLAAGDYIVEIVPPAGYSSSSGAAGAFEPAPDPDTTVTDNDDNGTTGTTVIRSALVTLAAATEPLAAVETGGNTLSDPAPDNNSNLTVDFGLFRPVSLGNLVWEDRNNNGQIDTGEPTLDGVRVRLLDSAGTEVAVGPDGILGTADDAAGGMLTDANGRYLFRGLLPGDYRVELSAANFAAGGRLEGYTSSTGTNGSPSGPFEAAPDPDTAPGDTDDNGTISGTLGAGGVVQSSLVTLTHGGEPIGENPNNDNVTPDNAANLTVDFGLFRPARLGDRVWYDQNRNGVQDGGETGIPNVTATLYNASTNAVVATAITDATGNYGFTNLIPGSYYVIFSNLPTGYVFTTANNGDDTLDSDANAITGRTGNYALAAGDNVPTVDAGAYNDTRARIGDRVWYDANEDGKQDAGENGVPGITVELYQAGGATPLATTTTDQHGNYLFSNLLEDTYEVRVILPANYAISPRNVAAVPDDQDSDANPADGRMGQTRLDPGESDLTWDAGIYSTTLALGNRVWEDRNNSGLYDPGEPALAGVTVRLFASDGTTEILVGPDGILGTADDAAGGMLTDSNGFYLFRSLVAGDYIVEVVPPTGYLSSSGTNGSATGPYEGAATPDPDGNPTDADDNGTTSGAVVRSLVVTLSRNGEPTGEATATPNPDLTTPDGNSNLTVDFGFYRPLSLGDTVWHDLDDNGTLDVGEPGIDGVTVRLYNTTNTLVATTTTAAGGRYSFNNLAPGSYIVEVDRGGPLAGYVSSTDIGSSANPDNDVNSDDNGVVINPTAVRSAAITLTVAGEPNDEPGLPAGNNSRNPTLDFGFYQPLNLGNLVWEDVNNNGLVNAGEAGIAGVAVSLYRDANGNGTPDPAEYVAGTVTDANGNYQFTNLRPGDYIVVLNAGNFTPGAVLAAYTSSDSAGYEPAGDPDNNSDNDDNGSNTSNRAVISQPITLRSADEPTNDGDGANGNLTVDFGLYRLASLGNLVWLDSNRDGVQDATEPGVVGIRVELYRPGPDGLPGTLDDIFVATTTTGGLGDYAFTDLPAGDYFVSFVAPPGYVFSPRDTTTDDRDSDADPVSGRTIVTSLTPGENDPTWDAGITFNAYLGDRVWLDQDVDGVQDSGEPGVLGVSVDLYRPGADGQPGTADDVLVTTTTTDANGNYRFSNLAPGSYYVRFAAPAGYQRSPADQGGNNNADSDADPTSGRTPLITITAGTADPTWDAGLYRLVSLGNLVWDDLNNNGLRDSNEPGLANVTVALYADANADGQPDGAALATTTTDSNGNYRFDNLTPGAYLVEVTPPAGYRSSSGRAANPTGPYEPAPGPDNDINDDDNGSRTGAGVRSGPVNLRSGTEPTNDGDNDPDSNLSVDFGLYRPASLGSTVWYDDDGDGLRDSNERGTAGVTVTLYNAVGTAIATVTTGNDGVFAFTELPPGSYSVGFSNLPAGYFFTARDVNGNTSDTSDSDANQTTGRTDLVTLQPGENNPTLYAGLINFTAGLGDRVWLDGNANGVQDSGEAGVPNVRVDLYMTGADGQPGTGDDLLIATTTTDANGKYDFSNLAPGSYYIRFNPPTGYYASPARQGGNATTDSDADPATGRTTIITLTAGALDLTWDAGLYRLMSLGDLVWNDTNNNGQRDNGEPGLAGVTVALYADANADGQPDSTTALATSITSAGGNYRFDNLVPGSYLITIVPPGGYVGSTGKNGSASGPYEPGIGGNSDRDNEDHGSTAGNLISSGSVTLINGTEPTNDGDNNPDSNLTIDFGLFQQASLGSLVWSDTNRDGIRDMDEPGVPGVRITLLDNQGNEVASTTTDANGNYQFNFLVPGSYRVRFSNLPADRTFTTRDQGANDGNDSDVDPETGLTELINIAAGQNNLTIWAGLVPVRPTAITLERFSARWDGEAIVVSWATSMELNTFGFRLLRSTSGNLSDAVEVTPALILGQGRGNGGAGYSWRDTTVQPGTTYTYWLEEVEIDGTTSRYGPAGNIAQLAERYQVALPLVMR